MERVILHVDCNKFYASVECLMHPELRGKPVVVGGNEEARHGIVLTKNEIASHFGIQTAEPLWKARAKCPDLIIVPPNYPLYKEFSRRVNEVFSQYTDQIEPFGIDESWLDVTGSLQLFGTGEEIAHQIRRRIKNEIGITVSIGVSFNKIFAKLGSDYKKPDAVTVFSRENYQELVWQLPADEMLFIGKATIAKLNQYGLYTIGDVAKASPDFLRKVMGKHGVMLHTYANGMDLSPVKQQDFTVPCKSIGNSTTTPRDMCNNADVKRVFIVLAENIMHRMREESVKADTITITVKDVDLQSFTRQGKTENFTNLPREIIKKAMDLFVTNYQWRKPLRAVGITVSNFESDTIGMQLDFTGEQEQRIKQETLEKTVDTLRKRFGSSCIKTASVLGDSLLTNFSPAEEKTTSFYTFYK